MRAFASAWLLYGVCETLLAIAFPALRARISGDAFGHHAGATALMLAFYPLAGAALGAAVQRALGVRDARDPRLALLASASVVTAIMGGLIARGDLGKSGVVVAAGFAALFAAAALDARRGAARRGIWALASPWVAVPLIVVTAWLLRALLIESPLTQRLVACAAFGVLWLGSARFLRSAIARAWLTGRGALRGSFAIAALLGIACAVLLRDTRPALSSAPPGPVAGTGASVVLVILDTVRADHLSFYGYARETSPALAAFARDALVFEQMTTPGDMTLTSHASLFTGEFVSRHGATVPNPVLDEAADTLAERLARAGYASYGVAANCGWIGKGHGIDQGFAHWDTRCGRPFFGGVPPVFLRQFLLGALRRAAFREEAGWRWRSAREISDEALRVVAHLDAGGAPFMLFLNYMDVHRPIRPPARYQTRFPGYDAAFDMSGDWTALHVGVNAGTRAVTAAERAHLESQYDGAIAYIDDQLKRVFDDLRARGLFDESLVIVTSDHGEGFGDHATFGHGHGVHQDVVHAPLIVKLPSQHAGRRIATPVSLVDVMPTVLAALGLPPAAELDGVSLLGDLAEDRALFAESLDGRGEIARALRRGPRKLLRHRGRETALYDLASDPDEQRDLSGVAAAEVNERDAELAAWLKAQEGRGPRATLSPEEAERLKALGYLQ